MTDDVICSTTVAVKRIGFLRDDGILWRRELASHYAILVVVFAGFAVSLAVLSVEIAASALPLLLPDVLAAMFCAACAGDSAFRRSRLLTQIRYLEAAP